MYKLFIDDERFPVSNDWVIARSSTRKTPLGLSGFGRPITFEDMKALGFTQYG